MEVKDRQIKIRYCEFCDEITFPNEKVIWEGRCSQCKRSTAKIVTLEVKEMLPPNETQEADELKKLVIAGKVKEAMALTGHINRDSFMRAMRFKYDFYISKQLFTPIEPGPEPVINLPPVKLREYKPRKVRRGDEEEAVALASDGHADKITNSYNKDVYRTRMGTYFESIMAVIKLHRNMYPINKLHLMMLGDNVQGENPHQGSQVGEITMGARDQTIKLATPMWNDVIGSLKQEFAEVIVECFAGNHGYEKLAPETSREDLRLYDLLKEGIGRQKGITINIHERWCGIVTIMGFKFFCFHGDGIPCQQGVPFFALDKKLKSWHMQFGGFNYALGGHFHKRHSDEISSQLEYFMTGSLVSDDDWALKKLGISSNPSQFIFGVHKVQGVTWRYPLCVDKAFMPKGVGSDG